MLGFECGFLKEKIPYFTITPIWLAVIREKVISKKSSYVQKRNEVNGNAAITWEYEIMELNLISRTFFVLQNHQVHPLISFQSSFHSEEIFVHVNLKFNIIWPNTEFVTTEWMEVTYILIYHDPSTFVMIWKFELNAVKRNRKEDNRHSTECLSSVPSPFT